MLQHSLRSMVFGLALGCGGTVQAHSEAGGGDAAGGGSDSGSSDSTAGDDAAGMTQDGSAGDEGTPGADVLVPSYSGLSCVPTTRYLQWQPCDSTPGGSPLTAFECLPYCREFASLIGDAGLVGCTFSHANDGPAPFTDAGTLVLCCPVGANQFPSGAPCEGPFM